MARERRERAAAHQAQCQAHALEIFSCYLLPLTIVTNLGGINYGFLTIHGGWWWFAAAPA